MNLAAPIFVEIDLKAPMSELWRLTQEPAQHQRWDLRFAEISYLPPVEGQPQRFRYATRIGLGLVIAGEGETLGAADRGSSALRFWSDDPLSLIRQGSGCWIYKPEDGFVRFRTIYDYEVRHGWVGRALDRLFRPLMGWATAWSFDRLRLWLEDGIPPAVSRAMALLHGGSRILLAVAWAWHGLVPKWLYPEGGELALLAQTGLAPGWELTALRLMGLAELAVGVLLLTAGRSRLLLGLVAGALLGLTLVVSVTQPETLTAPFPPLTLNLALLGLLAAAWLTEPYAPSARRCRRRMEGRT